MQRDDDGDGDGDGDALHRQLRKLSAAAPPEESVGQVLQTLWSTRKTGLASHQKPSVQSLLNLPSLENVDPVLACLRSIIRLTLTGNLNENSIQMLFPLDISDELQRNLILSLIKYQNQWKEETSGDQPLSQVLVSNQGNATDPPAMISSQLSDSSLILYSKKRSSTIQSNCSHIRRCVYRSDDLDFPRVIPASSQQVNQVLPHLKSMNWVVENRTMIPTHRVVVMNLKLQDNSKSPPSEMEIKFHLTKDTLEAMLRSMACIKEQLSKPLAEHNFVAEHSGLTNSKEAEAITDPSKCFD